MEILTQHIIVYLRLWTKFAKLSSSKFISLLIHPTLVPPELALFMCTKKSLISYVCMMYNAGQLALHSLLFKTIKLRVVIVSLVHATSCAINNT